MAHALHTSRHHQSAVTIPTKHEIGLFFLSPRSEVPELAPEWDEDDLTKVKYYSPTSD